jgi:hypothetical protein
MKLLLILLLPIAVSGQMPAKDVFPLADSSVYYEKVFTVDGIKKDTLYTRARQWALNTFVSQKSALQSEDREGGVIYYHTFLQAYIPTRVLGYSANAPVKYWFFLKIYAKDGKAKIVIDRVQYAFEEMEPVSVLNLGKNGDQAFEETYKLAKMKIKDQDRVDHKNQMDEYRKSLIALDVNIRALMEDFGRAISKKGEAEF